MYRDFLKSKMTGEALNSATGLNAAPKSQAKFVDFGYGQVEPNHLSAQRTGQIYAQLPAKADIELLEQGQFVKYNYAANDNGIGLVDFEGEGEWMLVYNEIKLYRDHIDGTKQWDCEFAMLKDDYQARVYSPYDYEHAEVEYKDWHRLNASAPDAQKSEIINQYVSLDISGKTVTIEDEFYDVKDNKFTYNGTEYEIDPETKMTKTQVPVEHIYDDVTKDVEDYLEFNFTNDPWTKLGIYREKKMPAGTAMVPRVFKTNVGDIYTTNMIDEEELAIGDILAPNAKGILAKNGDTASMKWQVVKIYTMPDNQPGVKVMRIA